ncbi:hypothetical protein [Actinocrispum wychmicini]|uniref:MoxR-vWA-beta-propeller ternary system domain-containing protein n=1 Tax=Actinocrispum wychmicini TaxID=1213861 RepID=A0A4R2JXJ8_9PSEU|nr:hypothetical protein [Actinocrispum wychmicini]TCO62076.1 hypothetical protein EV192_102213 [Actinocrispum wychmicini]
MNITWTRREPPLRPVAVAGTDSLYDAARKRLADGVAIRAAVGDGWTLILGDDLPWADGAVYLGWEDGLLVPTLLRPSVPSSFLKAALPDALAVLPGRVLTGAMPVRQAELA